MPRYTFQAGAHWPNSLIDLTNYKDADNTVGPIIAQIKAYQEAGDFDSAQQLIMQHASTLKKYCFDSAAINKYIEELRNLMIYSKAKKQQIFYEPTEDSFATYAVLQDVWLGNIGDGSQVYDQSTAQDFQVLEGITYVGSDGKLHTGTMPNYEAVEVSIDQGQTYTIPAGYHNGGGTVTTSTIVPPGENLALGPFTKNHVTETGISVAGASTVSIKIDVPGVVEGMITTQKGDNEINCPQEIKHFFYVTGVFNKENSKSSVAYSVRCKLYNSGDDDWKKFDNTSGNSKIKSISGTKVIIHWDYVTDLYYYGY